MRNEKAFRIGVSALLMLAVTALPAPSASAAPRGDLTLLGCVTGNNRVAMAQGCRTVPGSGGRGDDAGLLGVAALAGGGTSASLYAIGSENSAITQLVRGASPRSLAFAACLTGDTFIEGSCTAVPGAYANADQAPIAAPTAAAISLDGRSLYLVSGSFHGSVVARFSRDPLSGALTYVDCLTGDTNPGPPGVLACTPIPGATRSGYGSGLNEPSGIMISRDGRHVYVTARSDESLTTFNRDQTTGALTFAGCVSSNERTTRCSHVSPGSHVLAGLGPPLSPDGRFLYAAAGRAGTIATFRIGAAGMPSFVSCLGGSGREQGCRYGRGPVQALEQPTGLAASGEGHFLYAASGYGSIVVLRRNAATGALTPVSCLSDKRQHRGICQLTPNFVRGVKASVLTGVRNPLLSADGRRLFAPVRTQDAIVELRRNRRTGALSFLSCTTGNLHVAKREVCEAIPGATRRGGASGFYKMTALARGPQGQLYAASGADATVWVLRP